MVLVHTASKRHQMSTSHDSSTRVRRQDVEVQKENMHKETLKKFDGVVDSRVTSIDTA